MNYLKKYGIDNDQISKIIRAIYDWDVNIDVFEFDSDHVIEILDIFESIGVTNFFEIMVSNPSIFSGSADYVRRKIDEYGNKEELGRLLNDDAYNLCLIGLL